MENNICQFCLKEFSNKVNLLQHQKSTKNCLQIQGKEEKSINIECVTCKKILAKRSYKQHKIKCDENSKHQEEYIELQNKYKTLEKKYKKMETTQQQYDEQLLSLKSFKDHINELVNCNQKLKEQLDHLKLELAEVKGCNVLLKEQNDKFHVSSTNVTMRLADKVNTTVNNKTLVINTNLPLTNDVLRQCANTFNIDNAYNINGVTKHLTSSLEEHITCTDPSRNIFKYTNEKDEEIVDPDLEMLLPQYLSAVKDRNDFLYKEVFEYFKENNVSFDVQTDYKVFYNALNNIIEKTGQQSKYNEKCKQQMVRECKKQFLEKNKNKEKTITKKLSIDEVMMNVIETGGTVHDFVSRVFPRFGDTDEEETDEQFIYRREMEDLFRQKKREWKHNITVTNP